jgi:hypothetical protein
MTKINVLMANPDLAKASERIALALAALPDDKPAIIEAPEPETLLSLSPAEEDSVLFPESEPGDDI